MLIVLGIILQYVLKYFVPEVLDFCGRQEPLGSIGLIMIALEVALELELKREKLVPILKTMAVALLGLLGSAYVASLILNYFIPGMRIQSAWIYATPLSMLSSGIIIPSVADFPSVKKSSIFMKVRFPTSWES